MNYSRDSVTMQPNSAFKMQDGFKINLPPNYQLYAKQEQMYDDENQVTFHPRLGENNPQTSAARKSRIIDFDAPRMQRLDLEELLNPQAKDTELMNRELEMYRDQVRQQNEEVQQLEQVKQQLYNNSFRQETNVQGGLNRSMELRRLQQEKEALLKELNKQPEVTQFVSGGNFFDADSEPQVRVQQQPKLLEEQPGGFFDRTEDVTLDPYGRPLQNNNQYQNYRGPAQNDQEVSRLENDGYHFY